MRGYGEDSLGPRDIFGAAAGGAALLVLNEELRFPLVWRLRGVAFLDAGNVYDTNFPNLGKRVFLGAGIGARYYTGLGPLRFDIAAPLHRRSGDRPFQIYVSLGQAF